MAFDYFLKIDNLKGESTDDKHKDWIEVLSYNTALKNSNVYLGAGRVVFDDFSIVKRLDKTSPLLNLSCASGAHIKQATLELVRTKDRIKYMTYTLGEVLVTGVRAAGGAGDDTHPMEEVSFNFGKIEWVYVETDAKTGKPIGEVKTSWSVGRDGGG